MQIIGIHGRKGNGKSLLSALIRKQLQEGTSSICPFAAKLKQVCHILFGGEYRHWWGTDADKNETKPFEYWADLLGESYSSGRRILQTVGTEVFRENVLDNFWLCALHKAILDNHHDKVVIIDDVRFENEVNFIVKNGGKVYETVYLNAPESNDKHLSEKKLPSHLMTKSRICADLGQLEEYAKEIVSGLNQP